MKMHCVYHRVSVSFAVFLVLSIPIANNDAAAQIIEYQNPTHCKKYEMFNSTSLSCALCNFTQNLEPSENRLHCVCNKNSKIIGFENGAPICELCKSQTIVSLDGMHCIRCRSDSKKCLCLANEIRVEKNASGGYLDQIQCLPCPANARPSSDKSQCVTVIPRFSYGDLTKLHFSSFKRTESRLIGKQNYVNQTVDDYYLRMETPLAIELCKNGSSTACEHLSNMCTLSMFSNNIVCQSFLSDVNSQVWLFYNKQDNEQFLNNEAISMKYSLKSQDPNSKINISVITHKLNGEFHSIDKPGILCAMLENIKFGINVNKSCLISAEELLKRETLFFSPYLTYREDDKLLLHNVPILVRNVNKSDNISEWQLVKKLILVDTVSGFTLMNSSDARSSKFVARYLESLSVILTIQPNSQNRIFPPLIVVNYKDLTEEQVAANQDVSIRYEVRFIVKSSNIDRIMKISTGVLSGFVILYSMLKTWSYCKRNHDQKLHVLVVLRFIIFSLGLVANTLTVVAVCTCIYIFILYKGQTIFHIPLPDANVEKNIMLYTILAFAFKCIEMVNFVYHHRTISIFFVDWEQPRIIYTRSFKKDSPSPVRKSRQKRRRLATPSNGVKRRKRSSASSLRRTQFSDSRESLSIIHKPSENVDNEIEHQAKLPVSIWRTYFVANEWFELQTIRKISILVHVICILFVLEVIGMKYYSRAIPELKLETDEDVENSLTLLYGVGALTYISFYIIQWLFVILFYEKCIDDKIQHFVDLCSVANISTFILVYRYYGFYIHGRSVHGFADTDLQTLTNDLQKEENNLCAHRGLVPGTVDQTFVINISPAFRFFYDKLLYEQVNDMPQDQELLGCLAWQRNFQSHLRVKTFLTGFIDHCFYEMDYIIKDKLLLEKLLDIEFQSPMDKTIFYTDYKHSFEAAMLYGNEWTLGTFEVILFIFVLTFSRDYVITCLVTLVVSQLVVIVCKCNGKKNLANKTLIDDRFIM